MMDKVNLRVNIGGVELKNPVMPASGTFGVESADFVDCSKIGAIVPKSFTLNPQQGNPPPRVVETPCGMLNAVGIQNKGLEHFVKVTLPFFEPYGTPVIASVSAYSEDDFKIIINELNKTSTALIELNISCPNLKEGGKAFGISVEETYNIVKAAKSVTEIPLITKLSPNVTDITEIALAAENAGTHAISLVNTFLGMAIDIKTMRPKLANITGGLSGPAIKPLALRMVWQVAQKVKVPVIGIGGISTGTDAIEFLLAGASAVQVGTYNFIEPGCMEKIISEIQDYMVSKNIVDIHEVIGGLKIR
jgi:dihydroorotate dehydrogenase (NAD+) catalytic subunit